MKSVLQILVVAASITVIAASITVIIVGRVMLVDYLGPHDYFVAYDVEVYDQNSNQNETGAVNDIPYTASGFITLTANSRRISPSNLSGYIALVKAEAFFEYIKNESDGEPRENIKEYNTKESNTTEDNNKTPIGRFPLF